MLNETEVYRPNPYANCRFCDFQTLCPLYPEGQPVFSVESVRTGGERMSTKPTTVPAEIVTAMGAPPTDEQWAAISMPLQPYVLVAGAGSGKTSVMAARVVYLALAALGRIEADLGATPASCPATCCASPSR